jgi:hypothetical protein
MVPVIDAVTLAVGVGGTTVAVAGGVEIGVDVERSAALRASRPFA